MIKRIISVCILIALILVIFIAGFMFAKYYKKSDTSRIYASIARWSFESEKAEKTIYLSKDKIYPGSNGRFEIEINAENSEVEVEYEILVKDERNIPTNMSFIAEIQNEKGGVIRRTKEYNSFTELASNELKEKIPVQENNQKRKIIVYWSWKFNENDTSFVDYQDATLIYDEERKIIFRVFYRY